MRESSCSGVRAFPWLGYVEGPSRSFFSNRAVQEAITHETQEFLMFGAGRQ
jgi:hypothetical protein